MQHPVHRRLPLSLLSPLPQIGEPYSPPSPQSNSAPPTISPPLSRASTVFDGCQSSSSIQPVTADASLLSHRRKISSAVVLGPALQQLLPLLCSSFSGGRCRPTNSPKEWSHSPENNPNDPER